MPHRPSTPARPGVGSRVLHCPDMRQGRRARPGLLPAGGKHSRRQGGRNRPDPGQPVPEGGRRGLVEQQFQFTLLFLQRSRRKGVVHALVPVIVTKTSNSPIAARTPPISSAAIRTGPTTAKAYWKWVRAIPKEEVEEAIPRSPHPCQTFLSMSHHPALQASPRMDRLLQS